MLDFVDLSATRVSFFFFSHFFDVTNHKLWIFIISGNPYFKSWFYSIKTQVDFATYKCIRCIQNFITTYSIFRNFICLCFVSNSIISKLFFIIFHINIEIVDVIFHSTRYLFHIWTLGIVFTFI